MEQASRPFQHVLKESIVHILYRLAGLTTRNDNSLARSNHDLES
jgi:hypothetical protein